MKILDIVIRRRIEKSRRKKRKRREGKNGISSCIGLFSPRGKAKKFMRSFQELIHEQFHEQQKISKATIFLSARYIRGGGGGGTR